MQRIVFLKINDQFPGSLLGYKYEVAHLKIKIALSSITIGKTKKLLTQMRSAQIWYHDMTVVKTNIAKSKTWTSWDEPRPSFRVVRAKSVSSPKESETKS